MSHDGYVELLEQVENLLAATRGCPDAQLELLHLRATQTVRELRAATDNVRRGFPVQNVLGPPSTCNSQPARPHYCSPGDQPAPNQPCSTEGLHQSLAPSKGMHEVLAIVADVSVSSKLSVCNLSRIPEVPSLPLLEGLPEHMPCLASLQEQFVQAQVRAVARRLIPPSSIAPGTQLQVLDESCRAWQDAVVQGLSPAGTCLQVTIEDTKQTMHVPPTSVWPLASTDFAASCLPGQATDVEARWSTVPAWLQTAGDSHEGDGRSCRNSLSAMVCEAKVSPAEAALTDTCSKVSGQDNLHSSDSRLRWVDPTTFWDSVRRNDAKRQNEETHKTPGNTNARVKKLMRRALQYVHTKLVVTGRVLIHEPTAAVIPVVVLLCLLGLGLWGVYTVSDTAVESRRANALTVATSAAQRLMTHINATMTPASTLAMLIMLQPSFSEVNSTFHKVAPQLLTEQQQRDGVINILLCPNGIVQSFIPAGLPSWGEVYGLNLLKNRTWRPDALRTVELSESGMVMTGPVQLRAGPIGLVARYAVFVEGAGPNETFNAPGEPHNCSACYRPARPATATLPAKPQAKFWGFSQLAMDWNILTRDTVRLFDICGKEGLMLQMTYVTPAGVNQTIASCGGVLGKDPLFVNVDIMHNHWVMAVTDQAGWQPAWLGAVITIVVLVSLAIALLLLIVLVNRREHMWLLQAMLPKEVISTLQRGEAYCQSFDNVTILFSDVVSYTTMASQLAPIDIVSILNEMYSAYDALVDDYECYKVETIGDAFFAVCGTQGESPTVAAAKIAGLALAMVERTRSLLASGSSDQRLQIRIGMHSGPVVGAVLGKKMPHFCLCGDTVNVANRMESNSSPMRIHMSSTTTELLELGGSRRWMPSTDGPGPENSLVIQPRGPVEIKGKGVMNTYWLDSVEGITGVKGGRGGHRPTGDGSGPRRRSMRPPGTSSSEVPVVQLQLVSESGAEAASGTRAEGALGVQGAGLAADAEARAEVSLQDLDLASPSGHPGGTPAEVTRKSPQSQEVVRKSPQAQRHGQGQGHGYSESLAGVHRGTPSCSANGSIESATTLARAVLMGSGRLSAVASDGLAAAAAAESPTAHGRRGSGQFFTSRLSTSTASGSVRWSPHLGPGASSPPGEGVPMSSLARGANPGPSAPRPPLHSSLSSKSLGRASPWDLMRTSVAQALKMSGRTGKRRQAVDLRIFQARKASGEASASAGMTEV